MRKESEVYKKLVQQLIEKFGTQAFIGIQEDIATLTKNIEKMYLAVDKKDNDSWDDFDCQLQNIIQNDFEKIQNDNSINYALKYLDFQHYYVAFRQLENKYQDKYLTAVFFFSRGVLDNCCSEMALKLQNFKL